jgi:hypothetical protein
MVRAGKETDAPERYSPLQTQAGEISVAEHKEQIVEIEGIPELYTEYISYTVLTFI